MARIILKGSDEDKFNQIQVILNQLVRKSAKTIPFAISPIPISFYQDSMQNEKLTHMFSMTGSVDTFIFYCDAIDRVKRITFNVAISNDNISTNYFLDLIPGRTNVVNKKLVFSIGDKMSISCAYEGELKNVWFAFPANIGKENFNYNQILIDELDKASLGE